MGRQFQHKHSNSYWENHHPDCNRGLFHIIKHHPLRHFMKRLTYKRGGGETRASGAVPARRGEYLSAHKKKGLKFCQVGEKVTPYSSVSKNSVGSQIKALIKEISKKKSRHRRSSTCPILSHPIHTSSIHDLEPSNIDPFSETVLTNESTRTKRCVQCGATPGGHYCEYKLVRKHKQRKKDLLLQGIKDRNQCMVEDKLTHKRKHRSGASNHFCKHFVDALDTIKMNKNKNKDLLLTFMQDPVSPLVNHFHKQQVYSTKMRLTRSVSFPLSDSLSKRRGFGAIGNGYLQKGKGKSCFGNKTQKSVQFESSKNLCEEAMPSVAKWRENGNFNINEAIVRDVNPSSGSAQGQNQKESKHAKNLKQKIDHVTGESRKEKLRVTMDAVIHKLPQGHGISYDLKKEIFKKMTEPNVTREGEYCSPSCNDSDLSTYSFPKDHKHSIRRNWSLQDSLESYCQLHENSFNTEASNPQSEQLKLRTEKACSPLRKQIPFQRILSLPDLQSFTYAYQIGEISDILSLTEPIKASKDGTMSSESIGYQKKKLGLNVQSKSPLQLDTILENLNQENHVSVGENDLVTGANIVGSGSDCSSEINDKVSMVIDDFGHSSLKNDGTSNDQDIGIGPIKEYKAAIAASDSKSKPESIDRVDNVAEQQEANMDSLVAETTESAQKVEILTKQLNYEIPHFHVDTRDKADFNYVKYVLEISGLTGNDCLSAWHSSDQPIDPLLYEEMEGDPDFCTYEAGQCNHHVLFDLINETLLEIYGKSYCYLPIQLSYLPHIHPMSVGCHILHQVWTHMSKCMRSKPGQTIDDHVNRDLTKHGEWVNLQLCAECVGLELEDLIFHDLLEEIMWDLASL